MSKNIIEVDPAKFPWLDLNRYTFCMGAENAGILYLSGQTASEYDPQQGRVVCKGDLLDQTRVIYEKLAVVLEAARKVLREGNLLDKPGRFPAGEPMGLELSKEADYYHRQGMPFLQRYLPFQVASAIDRYVVLIIPFIAIMFPLLKTMGPLYRWRVRARVYRWYEHLRRIDKLIYSGKIKQQYAEQIQGLKALESELNHVDVPLSYAHELYSLHLHVRYMIYRLETLQAEEEGGEKSSLA